jgi:hypothetical protein
MDGHTYTWNAITMYLKRVAGSTTYIENEAQKRQSKGMKLERAEEEVSQFRFSYSS